MMYYELLYIEKKNGIPNVLQKTSVKYFLPGVISMLLGNLGLLFIGKWEHYLKFIVHNTLDKDAVYRLEMYSRNYIHPTAIIGENVSMGAGNIINAGVHLSDCHLGNNNTVHAFAIIKHTALGDSNKIGYHTCIGTNGEIRDTTEFKGAVCIGDNNVISEFVSIQRPAKYTHITNIGDCNLIMAHSHFGHDVQIGSNCEICTGTILGGYSNIMNGAKLKLGVTIRNRKTIGENALVGLGSSVVKDVPAGETWFGNPAKKYEKPEVTAVAEQKTVTDFTKVVKIETWADLKEFASLLNAAQLTQKIVCAMVDSPDVKVIVGGNIMLVDHINPSGEGAEPLPMYLEGGEFYDPEIKAEEETVVFPAGTVYLDYINKI